MPFQSRSQSSDCAITLLFAVWSLLLLLCTWGGHLYSPDCEVNYRTVRSLAQGEGYAIPPYPEDFGTRTGIDGKEYPQYGPLQPLLTVPLYVVGNKLAPWIPPEWLSFQADRLGRTVGFYRPLPKEVGDFQGLYPSDHTERVRRIFVSLFNPLVTWLTTLLLLFWSRRLFPGGTQWLILPSAYLLATIAWPYSKPFYTEALATLCLLLAAWTADSVRHTTDEASTTLGNLTLHFLCVGCFTGLAVLTRLDSAVACPGLAVIAIGWLFSSKPENSISKFLLASCVGVFAFGAVISMQFLLNQMHFGSPLASGYSDQPEGIEFNIPVLTSLWIYLISPGKGIFWYSPPLLAALLVWPAWLHRDRFLAGGAVLIVLGYLLVVGRWQNLGGWCWGPRHLVQLTPFLLMPLPLLLVGGTAEKTPRPGRVLMVVTVLLGVGVQLMGVLVDFMWPLDQTMRGLAPGEDTARVLSLPYFGPILHLWSWRLDPDPDWFLYDLWRSGMTGARLFAGLIWGLGALTLSFLLLLLFSRNTLETNEHSHDNIGIME